MYGDVKRFHCNVNINATLKRMREKSETHTEEGGKGMERRIAREFHKGRIIIDA